MDEVTAEMKARLVRVIACQLKKHYKDVIAGKEVNYIIVADEERYNHVWALVYGLDPPLNGEYLFSLDLGDDFPAGPPKGFSAHTTNGIFETGGPICLSITNFHPESWVPAIGLLFVKNVIGSMIADDLTSGIRIIAPKTPPRRRAAIARQSYQENKNANGAALKQINEALASMAASVLGTANHPLVALVEHRVAVAATAGLSYDDMFGPKPQFATSLPADISSSSAPTVETAAAIAEIDAKEVVSNVAKETAAPAVVAATSDAGVATSDAGVETSDAGVETSDAGVATSGVGVDTSVAASERADNVAAIEPTVAESAAQPSAAIASLAAEIEAESVAMTDDVYALLDKIIGSE